MVSTTDGRASAAQTQIFVDRLPSMNCFKSVFGVSTAEVTEIGERQVEERKREEKSQGQRGAVISHELHKQ